MIKFLSQRRNVHSRSDQGVGHLFFEVETSELIWKTQYDLKKLKDRDGVGKEKE